MTAYTRGDYREKKAKATLEAHGYVVWQARGSHGVADLIALKRGRRALLVQVKSGNAAPTHGEWNKLYRLADSLGAVPVVVTCEPLNGRDVLMKWVQVLDLHAVNARKWPSRTFPFLGD